MSRGTRIHALLLSGTALVVLLVSSAVEVDERAFETRALPDTPIHLLSDSTLLHLWRAVGYRTAAESFDGEWDRFFEFAEHAPPENYDWARRETERKVRLLGEVGGSDARIRFFEFLTADRSRAAAFARNRPRFERCRRLINEGAETTPALLEELHRNAREAERIGARGWTGWLWETIADCHFRAGRPDSGLAALETALDCHRSVDNYASLVHVSSRIGYELAGRRRFAEADSVYRRSLAWAKRVGDPFLLSRVHAFTGSLRLMEGFHRDAETLFSRSLAACETTRYPLCEAARRLDLARLYADLGERSRALPHAARVVFALDSLLCSGVPLDVAVRHSCFHYLSAAHAIRGRLLAAEGRHDEAATAFARAAAAAADCMDGAVRAEALRRLAGARLSTGDTGAARRRIAEAIAVARESGREKVLASCLVTRGEIELAAGRTREAERVLERSRRIAAEEQHLPCLSEAERLLGRAAADRGDLREARRRFLAAFRLLAVDDPERAGRPLAGEVDLSRLGADLLDAEARIGDIDSFLVRTESLRRAGGGCGGGLAETASIARLVADRRWIPAGTALLRYCATPEDCFVAVADAGSLRLERIPASAGDIESLVDALVETGAATKPANAPCGRLAGLLLEPVATAIERHDVVCIMRDGPFRRLPFGLLPLPGSSGERLVERCEIRYAPCLLAAARTAARPALDRPLLVGEPLVDPFARRLYPHLRGIPGARREIASVRGRLGCGTVLDGAAATRPAVLERLAHANLFHIAAHTLRWPVYDGQAALLLASSTAMRRERDLRGALITPGDVAALDLNELSLVVLSACESSRAAAGDRDGLDLPEAFLEAGAGAVIASLWPVEDEAARRLVDDLYAGLLDGRSPAAALAAARRAALARARRAGREAESIGEWAPFVVWAPAGESTRP